MDIVKSIIEFIKSLILNRSFLIGFVICLTLFSQYILGPDNLLEEFGEMKIKEWFNFNIDASYNTPDPDLQPNR
jgi:hypothetical protein